MSEHPENRGAAPLPEKAATSSSSEASDTTGRTEGKAPFIPAWLDDAGLSAATFRVYSHLARSADNFTGIAWPSYQRMTAICGLGKSTVRRCLEELEGRKMISKAGKPFGGSCRYRVFPIVSPQGQLETSNGSTTDPIEAAPIVPPQDCNSPSGGTSIVPPQGQEGSPKKVPQRRESKGGLFPIGETLPFPSIEFKDAWQSWERHRVEIKKKLTPESVQQQFKKFASMGEARAIAAINHSIANGWQGIFEPSGQAPGPQPPAGAVTINGRIFKS